MKVANLVVEGEDIRKISKILYNHKEEPHRDDLHSYNAGDITILMRESYYERISSTLMSVIILKFIGDNKVEIEIVVSGGKEGILLLSLGAEHSEARTIIHEVMNLCIDNQWKITSMEPENILETLVESTFNKIKEKVSIPFKK